MYVAKYTNNSGSAVNATMLWQAASDWADNLVWLDKDDWREPTEQELGVICGSKGSLGAYAPDLYWSSTTWTGGSTYGACGDFPDCSFYNAPKTRSYYVRAVRTAD
jgi:hypothetical protein